MSERQDSEIGEGEIGEGEIGEGEIGEAKHTRLRFLFVLDFILPRSSFLKQL